MQIMIKHLSLSETDYLPVASMEDSDDILVGEWAIAISNSFDLGPTVINRDFYEPQVEYYYRNIIQKDGQAQKRLLRFEEWPRSWQRWN